MGGWVLNPPLGLPLKCDGGSPENGVFRAEDSSDQADIARFFTCIFTRLFSSCYCALLGCAVPPANLCRMCWYAD